jgi:hypothetical protein
LSLSTHAGDTLGDGGISLRTGGYNYNGGYTGTGISFAGGDKMMVAWDADAGKIWFGKNGTWLSGGDPGAGTNPLKTGITGTLYPFGGIYESNNVVVANFGATAFIYTVPTGFRSGWYSEVFDDSISEDASSDDAFDASVNAGRDFLEDASAHADFLDNMGELSEDVTANDDFDSNMDGISEDATASDDFDPVGSQFNAEMYEEISNHAEILGTVYYSLTINDGFALADAASGNFNYYSTCNESLILTDTSSGAVSTTINDGFMIYDDAQPSWGKTISDGFDIADTIFKILGIPCPDSLTVTDSVVSMWHGQEIIDEICEIWDLPKGVFLFNKTVDESLVLTDTVAYRLAVTVIENILMTSLATAIKDLFETVNDGAALTDEATKGFEKTINESLVNTDTVAVITSFFNSIAESLVGVDAASMTSRFWASLNESLVLTDTVASKGTLYNVVYDTLGFLATVEFAGETWETYVLNTPKFYPSQYSGFNFNSYTVFEGRAFGANDVGIYELTGTTDAGSIIRTGVVLNDTDFGSPNQKRFRRAYLGISGAAPKMVFETEDGKREVYDIDTQGKTVISSELKSKSWKLSISDFQELSSLKLVPVILTK